MGTHRQTIIHRITSFLWQQANIVQKLEQQAATSASLRGTKLVSSASSFLSDEAGDRCDGRGQPLHFADCLFCVTQKLSIH